MISGLVEQYKLVPGENPSAYLWLANCVLYSVVVTFLVLKGWKKDPKDKTTRRAHENDNWRNKFLEIVIHRNSRTQQNKRESVVDKKREEKPLFPAKGVQVFVSIVARKLH